MMYSRSILILVLSATAAVACGNGALPQKGSQTMASTDDNPPAGRVLATNQKRPPIPRPQPRQLETKPQRLYRFADQLHMAHVRSGGVLVDFGTPSRHKHTHGDFHSGFRGDYTAESTTYTYVTGAGAHVYFHAFDEEKGAGTISVRARAEGATKARVYLNGKYAGSFELTQDQFSHAVVSFDKGIIPGKNDITIRCNSKRRTKDGPIASIAIDYLRIVPGEIADGPAASSFDTFRHKDPSTGRHQLSLTAGESVTYYLPVPKQSKIRGESLTRTSGQKAKLSIVVKSDSDKEAISLEHDVTDNARNFELDLKSLEGEAAEITIQSTQGEVILKNTALVSTGLTTSKAPGKHQAKNFVLVLVDTLRADKIDLYNKETRVRSPFISDLGDEAMVFERTFAPENWTKPSIASMLTGLYPATHQTKDDRDQLPKTVVTIQEHLQSLGFNTAGFVANGYVSSKFGFKRGWDTWTNYVREGKPNRAQFVAKDAIEWLEKRSDDRPFFLYVHTIDPHVPYIPPKKYLSMYDVGRYDGPIEARNTAKLAEKIKSGALKLNERDKMRFEALYDGEITYHDDQLVHLSAKLRELGLFENTLLIVTSDHGEEFFDHGKVGHGHSLYEELLHVPMIVRLPGKDHPSSSARSPHEVSLVDIFPTACDILGVECPKEVAGRSLTPILTGQEWNHFPSVAFSEFLKSRRSARMGRYKLILRGLRTTLFDLTSDPNETHDLSDENPIALTMIQDSLGYHLGSFIEPPKGTAGDKKPKKRHKTTKATIDPETRRQLRALGYLTDEE